MHVLPPARSPIHSERQKRKRKVRFMRLFFTTVLIIFAFCNIHLMLFNVDAFQHVPHQVLLNATMREDHTKVTPHRRSVEPNETDHYPVEVVTMEDMRDTTGRPYVFQSVPETDAERDYYQLRTTKISPHNHTYIINGSGVCDNRTTFIVAVNSRPSNVAFRDSIRATWGSVARNEAWPHNKTVPFNTKLVFMFGVEKGWNEKLLNESQTYGDIVQADFTDAYGNMTVKTLLGMRWVIEHCPGVSYYLKSDDDMFINMPHLMQILASRPALRRTIVGPLALGSRVMRGGKWKLDRSLYPFKQYPPYELGSAYVMTADLVGELFQAAEYFPQIFIDDVFITGILGRAMGVFHARQQGFAFWTARCPSACDFVLDRIFTGHRCSGKILLDLWAQLQRLTWDSCKYLLSKKSPAKTVEKTKKDANTKKKAL